MNIWDLCIRRPVFTVMLVSAPIVMGLMAYLNMGVDLLPNVEMPVVVVTTTLKGAGVGEMEIARKQIKENLEGLPGVGAVILVGGRQRAINI